MAHYKVTSTELREVTGEAMKMVAQGHRVIITRYGKPIAALIPPEDLAILRGINP